MMMPLRFDNGIKSHCIKSVLALIEIKVMLTGALEGASC